MNVILSLFIYSGGGDLTAAVTGVFNGARIRIEDTLIRFNSNYALSFNTDDARIDSFDGNLILDNSDVGNVVASTAGNLAGNSRYVGNTVNELTIRGGIFEGYDITIPNVGIPISLNDLSIVSGSLTIAAGADVEMLGDTQIQVDGPVRMVGTAERPITLRGRSTTQGYWDGVRLYGQGEKVLNHVNISFGGANEADTGAIEIDCSNNNSSRVQIDNTDIIHSASWGIFSKGTGCTTVIGNTVTYSNNALGNSNVP